jgi:hypothetical protein
MQPMSNQNTKYSHCNTNNSSASSKKKKNKGSSNNCSQQQNNQSSVTATKSQHSTAKNTTSLKPSSGSYSSCAPSVGGKQQIKSGMSQHQQSSSAVIVNHAASDVLSVMSPLGHIPSVNQFTTATAIQINNVINTISCAGKTPSVSSSVAAQRLKSEATLQSASSQSFSLENLKLPPGITITKVDGPTAAALRKSQLKPSDNSKSAPCVTTSSHSSTTVISGPAAAAVNSGRLGGFGGGGGALSQGINGSNVIVVDTVKMKEELQAVTMNGGDPSHGSNGNSKKKNNKKKNKNQNNTGSTNVNGNSNGQLQRQQQVGNGVAANQINGKHINSNGGKSQNSQNSASLRIQPHVYPLLTKPSVRPQTLAMNATQLAQQPAIIKVNGSMVTIRNPALQQAMANSSRFPQQGNGQTEILVNGEMPTTKPGNKLGKKPANPAATNGIVGMKGKENGSVPPRFTTNADNVVLRNRLAPHVECNGLNSIPGLHISKVNSPNGRVEENGIAIRGASNLLPPRMRIQQQRSPPSHMAEVRKVNHSHVSARQEGIPPQHASAARSAMREAMAASLAAANDAKKKKKKKKGTGPQGHSDDWNLVGKFFLLVHLNFVGGEMQT